MAAKNPQIDPNDHYVLIGTRKDTGEQEPVHPGSVTLTEAKRVQRVLARQRITTTIWGAGAWEDKVDADNADLYCPVCGAMKEDCNGNHPDNEPDDEAVIGLGHDECKGCDYGKPGSCSKPTLYANCPSRDGATTYSETVCPWCKDTCETDLMATVTHWQGTTHVVCPDCASAGVAQGGHMGTPTADDSTWYLVGSRRNVYTLPGEWTLVAGPGTWDSVRSENVLPARRSGYKALHTVKAADLGKYGLEAPKPAPDPCACAWCGDEAEDAMGLGWPLCVPCGELYGTQTPPRYRMLDTTPEPPVACAEYEGTCYHVAHGSTPASCKGPYRYRSETAAAVCPYLDPDRQERELRAADPKYDAYCRECEADVEPLAGTAPDYDSRREEGRDAPDPLVRPYTGEYATDPTPNPPEDYYSSPAGRMAARQVQQHREGHLN